MPNRFLLPALIAPILVLGPAQIEVTTANLPAGAAAIIKAHYHTEASKASVYGTVYTWSGNRRHEREITLHKIDSDRWRLDSDWSAGTPIVVVVGVEQEVNGNRDAAEALIQVGRNGRVKSVAVARTKPILGRPMPRRVSDREIEDALQEMGSASR